MKSLKENNNSTFETGFSVFCYTVMTILILSLFIQNFIFSSNTGLLGFREIDDVAFQTTLLHAHQHIDAGKTRIFLHLNDYGYGWIYWAPLTLLTYPLHLINTTYNISWPLIVLPREISLLFSVLSLIVLHKLLTLYSAPRWLAACGLLIFSLLPSFGYFSLRFGTVSEVMFFSLLTTYLACIDNPSTLKGRIKIAVALAFSGGVKLSGLLVTPLIALLVISRLTNKSWQNIVKAAFVPSVVFLVCLAFLCNPALLTFKHKFIDNYFEVMNHFMLVPKESLGTSTPIQRFYFMIAGDYPAAITAFLSVFGLLLAYRNKHRFDIASILITLIICSLYLTVSVKNMLSSYVYFTSISFLLIIGVLGYEKLRHGQAVICCMIALLIYCQIDRSYSQFMYEHNSFNSAYYYVKAIKSAPQLQIAKSIDKCIGTSNVNGQINHIFLDHTAQTMINPIAQPKTCITMVYDNMSENGKYCFKPIDYIITNHFNAVGLLPEVQFNERIKLASARIAEGYLEDRKSRLSLINNGSFAGQKFNHICHFGDLDVYKAIS